MLGAAHGTSPCACALGHLRAWGQPCPVLSHPVPSPGERGSAQPRCSPQLMGGSQPPAATFTLGVIWGQQDPRMGLGTTGDQVTALQGWAGGYVAARVPGTALPFL